MEAARRDRVALLALVLLLAAYDVVRTAVLSDRVDPWANTAMILVVLAVARRARLDRVEMGLERRTLGAGVRWGVGCVALVGVVVLGAHALWGSALDFTDARVDVGTRTVLLAVFVRIPIATVAFEELAFRGTMLPLLDRTLSPVRALLVSAVLFGLWHLPPLWSQGAGQMARTFAATAVGGAVFVWLRRRSGSLLAPALAHWATNGFSLLVLWWLRA